MRISLTGDRTVRVDTVVVTVAVELAPGDDRRDLAELTTIAVELHTAATKGLHVAMDLCRTAPHVVVAVAESDPQVALSADAERGAREAAQRAQYRPRDVTYVAKHLRELIAQAQAAMWVQA